EKPVTEARQAVNDHLMALGTPPTKMYAGQLPLFPVIYRLEVRLDAIPGAPEWANDPIFWDSDLPAGEGQYVEKKFAIAPHASVIVRYQVDAYDKRQQDEQHTADRSRWVLALAVAGTAVAFAWMWLVQYREGERERQRREAQQQIEHKERRLLEEEVRRQEAE